MTGRRLFRAVSLVGWVVLAGCHRSEPGKPQEAAAPSASAKAPEAADVVRCAVIGGMITTGFWQELTKRYEQTGGKIEVVVSGTKRMLAPAIEKGEADLITMHSSDALLNLVADGFAVDAQPWARNDHVIVGPKEDPAKVRGMKDATEAMRKILAAKSPFVVHRGNGASEVLRSVLSDGNLSLDERTTLRLPDDANQENVLELASTKHGYSLVGFIPFKVGKMQGAGIEVMVEGDVRLRRPYLVAVTNPKRWPGARYAAAQKLAAYLRSPETQAWLAEYGRTQFGGHAPFSPVALPGDPKP